MNKKILLIDDNEDILDIFSMVLMGQGYDVATSSHANELMQLINDTDPGLIILDNWIGDIRGSEICKTLKSDPSYKHIPVILCSGTDDLEALSASAKADGYLQKPFSIDAMSACVDDVLNNFNNA